MKSMTALACVAMLVAAGCAGTLGAERIGTEAVTADYTTAGGQWNVGGQVYVLARAREHQGRLAICGLWAAHTSTEALTFNHEVVYAGAIELDGDRVLTGLSFLPEARFADDLTGRTATCVVTGRVWQPGDGEAVLDIVLPRRQITTDSRAGNTLRFRETAVPSLTGA